MTLISSRKWLTAASTLTVEPRNLSIYTISGNIWLCLGPPYRLPNSVKEDLKSLLKLAKELPTKVDVMTEVIPVIDGNGRKKYHSAKDAWFTNMAPIVEDVKAPKPDMYDGAPPQLIDPRVRKSLGDHIVPSNTTSRPAAPNFFVEAKSAQGRADVAKRQALHDGAVGARAMHSLQNYGTAEAKYDGNAYSHSAIFHGGTGTLQLYTHHMTRPEAPGGQPEYHMTQLRSFVMTDNAERFREGATAYRNSRDCAELQRNSFIEDANRVARHDPTSSPSSTVTRSRESHSATYEDHSDTSIEDHSTEEVITKRHKHMPSSAKTDGMSSTQIASKSISRHTAGRIEKTPANLVSKPITYSRHTTARDGEEPKRQIRPSQKVKEGWDIPRRRRDGQRSRHS